MTYPSDRYDASVFAPFLDPISFLWKLCWCFVILVWLYIIETILLPISGVSLDWLGSWILSRDPALRNSWPDIWTGTNLDKSPKPLLVSLIDALCPLLHNTWLFGFSLHSLFIPSVKAYALSLKSITSKINYIKKFLKIKSTKNFSITLNDLVEQYMRQYLPWTVLSTSTLLAKKSEQDWWSVLIKDEEQIQSMFLSFPKSPYSHISP